MECVKREKRGVDFLLVCLFICSLASFRFVSFRRNSGTTSSRNLKVKKDLSIGELVICCLLFALDVTLSC